MRTARVRLGKLYRKGHSTVIWPKDRLELEMKAETTYSKVYWRSVMQMLRRGNYYSRASNSFEKRLYNRTHRRAVQEDLRLQLNENSSNYGLA